ncbi:MAG: 5'-nucleotidase, lipoprotein e(P4) family [Balneolaceae bacterium]
MKALTQLFLFAFFLAACSSTDQITEQEISASDQTKHPTTQATLWVQNSAEYKALAIQSYNAATRILPLPLQDSYWTASLEQQNSEFASLPPAIILDVDETVLDNAPFQARMIKQDSGFDNEAWNDWCREANADAIPGAVKFTSYAAEQGINIFFVTNRDFEVEEATRQNLASAGFPIPDSVDNIFSNGEQEEWDSSKTERRKLIEQHYRVIMIFGDDLNDFLPAKNISEEQRTNLIEENSNYFGRRWFMLPNPVYGSWDQAMYGFNNDLSDEEKEDILLQHLDSKEKN